MEIRKNDVLRLMECLSASVFFKSFRLVTHLGVNNILSRQGVVVITSAQLHWTKSELRFCAGLNSSRGVSEICDGEDLWQWSRLEIRLNVVRRSTIPQKQFIIIFITIIIITIMDQHEWSTKIGYANALSLGTNSCKKGNVVTLNSAQQAKKHCTLTTVA